MHGVVIKNLGSLFQVRLSDGKLADARVKGNFRIKGIRTTNPVAVGDNVIVQEAGQEWYITKIEPRKNYIIRKASNLSKESHILAANIDQAALVISIKNPLTSTTFIDRFLATSEAYSVPAILVINKEDLWDEEDMEYAHALRHLYTTIGYKVIFTSAQSQAGLEQLKELLKDKITLLAGNSGVGKSSLINELIPGVNLRTGAISDIYHTGTHTTTFSEMLTLPEGGEVIDVPGVKGFGTIDFQKNEIAHYFPEIFKEGLKCRYSDCSHRMEPGCAVREAIDNHLIAESRYNSYLSILDDRQDGSEKYRKPF